MNYIYVIKKHDKDFVRLNPRYKEGLYIIKYVKNGDMFKVVDIISPKGENALKIGSESIPTEKWNLIGYGKHDTIEKIFTKPTEEWLK